jgi:hypothetical protein
VFREAGWNKARLRSELDGLLQLEGRDMIQGAGGIEEGLPAAFADTTLPKFRSGGMPIVHVGGTAGLFSAIIGGWASGAIGSELITREVRT